MFQFFYIEAWILWMKYKINNYPFLLLADTFQIWFPRLKKSDQILFRQIDTPQKYC